MKLTTSHDIEGNLAPLETAAFRIANSGKGFRILVDGLYSNKIRAVVREISTNAYDAHLAAKRPDSQFHVDLPTVFDATFRVRDYGTSMTHEQVMGLYTTIFESSKDETNEFVGALGLGSKSPYAYTDAFSVTAWLDGEERQYVMTMDAAGTPTVSLLARNDTDKPDGIEVAVPVDPNDMHAFEREAFSVLKAFDPQPTVTEGFTLPKLEPVFTTASGKAMVFHDELSEGFLQVKQGCVIYPVDDYSLRSQAQNAGFRSSHGANSRSLLLDVPIGSVEIAANREALSITPETREYLEGAITEAAAEIQEHFDRIFDSFPTRLAAAEHLMAADYTDWWGATPRYKGQVLNTQINLAEARTIPGVDADGKPTSRVIPVNPKDIAIGRRKNSKETTKLDRFDLTNRDRYTFVIMDSKQSIPRVSARYKQFIQTKSYWEQDYVYFCRDMTSRQIQRMMRLVGFKREQFVHVSNLPDPGPRERASNGEAVLSGVRYVNGRHIDTAGDMPDTYYWVEAKRPNTYDLAAYRRQHAQLVTLGGDDSMSVLVMTPSAAKRFKPDANLKLTTAIEIAAAAKIEEMKAALADSIVYRAFISVPLSDAFKAQMGIPLTYDSEMLALAEDHLSTDDRAPVVEQAHATLEEIKEKFPLLLDRSDEDAVQWYIEARTNAAEAANESEGN